MASDRFAAGLPEGVHLTPLKMWGDERGWLTEIFRHEWAVGVEPCQWNVTMSRPNVLRGMHVHHRHRDYLVVLSGRISVGLYDARTQSRTYRQSMLLEMSGDRLSALRVPTGVVHGVYCHDQTLYTYGVDGYYDPEDELACHWADPRLGICWPCQEPTLSERDRAAGALADLEARLRVLSPEFA
jgi:dTDP-4-dehydrorhamnose 3,5-epimerase